MPRGRHGAGACGGAGGAVRCGGDRITGSATTSLPPHGRRDVARRVRHDLGLLVTTRGFGYETAGGPAVPVRLLGGGPAVHTRFVGDRCGSGLAIVRIDKGWPFR